MKRLMTGVASVPAFYLGLLWAQQISPSVWSKEISPVTYRIHEVSNGVALDYLKAYRSDGSRMSMSLPSSKGHTRFDPRNIFLPHLRKHFYIYDELASMSTYYVSSEVAANAGRIKVSQNCRHNAKEDAVLLGTEIIVGLGAFHWMKEFRNDRGESQREEEWLSPDIDCREVKRIVYLNGEKRFERILEWVKRGPPEAHLFEAPNFKEILPSEAGKEIVLRARGRSLAEGDPKDKCILDGYTAHDKKYRESQVHKP